MCLLLSLAEIKRSIELQFWNQLCPSVSLSVAKNANEAFESSFKDKGGNILPQSAKSVVNLPTEGPNVKVYLSGTECSLSKALLPAQFSVFDVTKCPHRISRLAYSWKG